MKDVKRHYWYSREVEKGDLRYESNPPHELLDNYCNIGGKIFRYNLSVTDKDIKLYSKITDKVYLGYGTYAFSCKKFTWTQEFIQLAESIVTQQ